MPGVCRQLLQLHFQNGVVSQAGVVSHRHLACVSDTLGDKDCMVLGEFGMRLVALWHCAQCALYLKGFSAGQVVSTVRAVSWKEDFLVARG
jgi:hypothetical protein